MAPKSQPLYVLLASLVVARLACRKSGNDEWYLKHNARIMELLTEYMPSGSGFDAGVMMDLDKSSETKLHFMTQFHHMTGLGMYDGWSDHTVIVTPNFVHTLDIRVTGRNRNDIKDHISETFYTALREIVPVKP